MGTNKIKRYNSIHELEQNLEDMNNQGYYIQSISERGNRILVVFIKDDTILDNNQTKDEEPEMDTNTWWVSE